MCNTLTLGCSNDFHIFNFFIVNIQVGHCKVELIEIYSCHDKEWSLPLYDVNDLFIRNQIECGLSITNLQHPTHGCSNDFHCTLQCLVRINLSTRPNWLVRMILFEFYLCLDKKGFLLFDVNNLQQSPYKKVNYIYTYKDC